MIFFRPAPKAFPVTQDFGENPQDYPKTHGHNGIDYGVPLGTKILAAASGEVIFAGLDPETAKNPKAGYGVHVRLRHPGNVLSLYGHLTDALVQVGEQVQVGEPIGLSGNTGRSTAPHLHFEVRTGIALVNTIDPTAFMSDTIPSANVLYSVEVTANGDGLRVRKAAEKDAKVMKNLHSGDVVQVLEELEDKTWLRCLDGYFMNNPEWIQRLGAQVGDSGGQEPAHPEDHQPDHQPEQALFTVQVTAEGDGLRLRSAPNTDTNANILLNLHTGDTREVLEEVPGGVWLRVRDGFLMNKPDWLQRV